MDNYTVMLDGKPVPVEVTGTDRAVRFTVAGHYIGEASRKSKTGVWRGYYTGASKDLQAVIAACWAWYYYAPMPVYDAHYNRVDQDRRLHDVIRARLLADR